jgi:hypothetical protein
MACASSSQDVADGSTSWCRKHANVAGSSLSCLNDHLGALRGGLGTVGADDAGALTEARGYRLACGVCGRVDGAYWLCPVDWLRAGLESGARRRASSLCRQHGRAT